jgi:two-component system OmpR family response regulator
MTLRKVLVVEDEVGIQKVIRMSLKLRGVGDVAVANDGEECLAVVNDVKPDVILMDVSMPKLDGYQTCRMLKANPETSSIPVIFLTAKVQKHEEEFGAEVGAAGYIAKPFDPMTLHDQIVAILTKSGGRENL